MAAPGYWKGNRAGGGAALPTSVTSNIDKVWVVYLHSMRKAMLVAAIALVLGSTVTANDNARDWPYFEEPQQYLINNLGEVLREQHALESCSQQQQEALQRFLNLGISYNAAALMAHSQYPCDSTDQ